MPASAPAGIRLAGVQADVARIGPDRRPHLRPRFVPGPARAAPGIGIRVAGVIVRSGDQRPHPGSDHAVQAACDPRGQRLFRPAQRRPDDPGDPVPGLRLLDPLLAHPREQRLTDPGCLPLPAAYLLGQPRGELLGVSHRELPEPRELPDRAVQPFRRPALPVEQPDVRRPDLHLPRDPGNRLIRQLRAARRDPAFCEEELQPQGQPQLHRPRPAGQQRELIANERPVLDQLVFVQYTRHGCAPRWTGIPAFTLRIHRNTGSPS
jgi:hypothetical protein